MKNTLCVLSSDDTGIAVNRLPPASVIIVLVSGTGVEYLRNSELVHFDFAIIAIEPHCSDLFNVTIVVRWSSFTDLSLSNFIFEVEISLNLDSSSMLPLSLSVRELVNDV